MVLICIVLGVATGMGATKLVTPSYSTTVKLYVSGTGATASERLQSGEYARSRVSSYADMITSVEGIDAARVHLGLPPTGDGSLGDLATAVTASNLLDTTVINVTVHAASPQRAQAFAAAIGAVENSVVGRLESPPDGRQSPVRIAVASPPVLPLQPDGPSTKLYAGTGLLAGLAVGAGLSWLLEQRRSKRRRPPVTSQQTGTSWSWWSGDGPTAGSHSEDVA